MILKYMVSDVLELKKPHACGCRLFRVLYAASDVRIACSGCGRELILSRVALDKAIRSVQPKDIQND